MHSAPAATSRSSAARTEASSRGSTTSPRGPIRSRTPRRRARGARNTGVWGSSRTSYNLATHLAADFESVAESFGGDESPAARPCAPAPRWWPPWCRAQAARWSVVRHPSSAASRRTAAMAASPGSAGVLGTLNTMGGRPSRAHTTSVNVPPTSTPTRQLPCNMAITDCFLYDKPERVYGAARVPYNSAPLRSMRKPRRPERLDREFPAPRRTRSSD